MVKTKSRVTSIRKGKIGGSYIEVRLLDCQDSYEPWFRMKARVNSEKEMRNLAEALNAKGIAFPKGSWW